MIGFETTRTTGFRELVSELDKLPVELQNKAVQYGIRRAARITQAAAKTEAPVRESGFLGPKRAGRKSNCGVS